MIVERREKFEKLSAYANVLKRLLEISTDSISVTDINGVIKMASARKVANHGMESHLDIIGKTDHDLFPKEEADKTFADTMHVIKTGETIKKIESLTLPSGIVCWYSVEKCPLRDSDGNIIGSICTSRDITELVRAQEKLEELNTNVINLLGTATHHIRGPIISLSTDIKLMQKGLVEDPKVAYSDMLAKLGRLENLVDRCLSFSAIANKGEPFAEKLDFREAVIDPILLHFKEDMAKNKIRYDNTLGGIPTDAVVILESDRTYLESILMNLIGNVIKYAGVGASFAVGHKIIEKDGRNFHEINVFDNGKKIPEEARSKLFDGGYSTGSTGLGLTQSLLLAQKLGGELIYEPNWEGYPNFILRIPVTN